MAEGELLNHEGREYCRFHAPIEACDRSGLAKSKWPHNQIEAFALDVVDMLHRAGNNEADFSGVIFPGDVDFSPHGVMPAPLPPINFRDAAFSRDAKFDGATFSGEATFDGATFSDLAVFDGAIFTHYATFAGATFSGEARLDGATFSDLAVFDGATFRKWVRFSGRGTGGPSEFNRISFGPHGKQPCRFESGADFRDREFRQSANFRVAVFATAPLFHGSRLHQDTDFTGVDWKDRGGEAAPAYRTLKLAMAEMRARDEEGKFAALEQECRRKRADTSRFVKALSYVYEKASGYGQYVGRPILWLMGVPFGFFHVYLFGFAPSPPKTFDFKPPTLAEVFRFTLRQIVDPFSALEKTEGYVLAPVFNDPPLGLALLAGVQSLLSLAMIALFLLALRWRFRRD